MILRLYSAANSWYKSKNTFDKLLDVLASTGIGVTFVMARGGHSLLHEFLAVANYITCLLLIGLKRPHKYIQIFYVFVILVVALVTDGFK